MKKEILDFFAIGRNIFGVCPRSGEIFRLSNCRIYLKDKVDPDWLDEIDSQERKLDAAEVRLEEREGQLRSKAREIGRKLADRIVRKIDTVFKPLRLNPDDSKVIFHPIDYVVFNGMNSTADGIKMQGPIQNITFLDRKTKGRQSEIQKSIQQVVEAEKYEWQTLTVQDDGKITSR